MVWNQDYYNSVHLAFEIHPSVLNFPDTSVVQIIELNFIELLTKFDNLDFILPMLPKFTKVSIIHQY